MAFDSKKTILLEKKYLYVRASLGFQLEGTSTEIIPTNNGFYRFYVDNLSKALGNSYVNIIHDSSDLSFQCFCSDLYMDELMSSDSSAIEDVVEELKKNTTTIEGFENGVSSAMQSNHEDNVATVAKIEEFQSGVSSGMASNHLDNLVIVRSVKDLPLSLHKDSSIFRAGNGYYLPLPVHLDKFLFAPARTDYSSVYTPCYTESYTINYEVSNELKLYAYWPCSINLGGDGMGSLFIVHFSDGSNLSLNGAMAFDKSSSKRFIYFVSTINDSSYFGKVISSIDLFLNTSVNSSFEKLRCGSYFKNDFSVVQYSKPSYLLRILSSSVGSPCLNLNFDFDFSGGYLNFQIECMYGFLNSLAYTFVTDVGDVTFLGSELSFSKVDSDSNLYICGKLPNIVVNGSTINKLLGLRVKMPRD